MTTIKPRDAILALVITGGFIVFQVGAAFALLGLLVVLGAVATLIYDKLTTRYDHVAADRLDASPGEVSQPAIARFLFHDTRSAPLWLAVRLYVGFAWLEAGYHKRRRCMDHAIREPTREEFRDLVRRRPTFTRSPHQIRDVNAEHERRLTAGQRTADTVAHGMGS